MKSILSFLFLLFFSVAYAENEKNLMDSANAAYAKNKFELAIKEYQQILEKGYESPELYYNLGNAYFKSKQIAMAILNYEKAKKLSPADEDIAFNLRLANVRLVDRIEPLPQLFFKSWWNNLLLSLSEKTWSLIYLGFIWLGFLGIVFYFLARKRAAKQLGFSLCIAAFALSFLFMFIALKSNALNSAHNEAVVLSATVSIKGSPSEQGTSLFTLHEGTKVTIQQNNGEWIEVKIPNGNRGWIKSSDLGVI